LSILIVVALKLTKNYNMTTSKKSWLKRNRKDLMKVILALLIVFFAVMGWQFQDDAKSRFWQEAWVWIAVGCLIVWVGVWAILWSSDKRENTGK
jgi:protein-S-isoprenylcysteine O-methyltransferase Ste14